MTSATQFPQTAGLPFRRSLSPALLLIAGSALVFLTFMRFGLAPLGWVVFAPFLVFLHEESTLKRHLTLVATLMAAWLLAVSKMATGEIPWVAVPMYAIPISVSYFVTWPTST